MKTGKKVDKGKKVEKRGNEMREDYTKGEIRRKKEKEGQGKHT